MKKSATAFHIMTKPRGAVCNLDCKYCYFLSKELLYPGSRFRMADEMLDNYVRQFIAAQPGPEVNFAWQGGEPTLMGLEFFERVVYYQQKYRRPGLDIKNSLQTNGTLLDDKWCQFFKTHGFLIGISIDGPREQHDRYRVDKGGAGSFQQVLRGWALLARHEVEVNILCTVHAGNQEHPLKIYQFFRDDLHAKFIQFIPIVERVTAGMLRFAEDGWNAGGGSERPLYTQNGSQVTSRSVDPLKYGQFLTTIFDEWIANDVGKLFVQIFDVALGAWLGRPGGLCIFAPTCGDALAMEHNGDLYSCDHFVEPEYKLGNIENENLIDLVFSEKQRAFGRAKKDLLPEYCRRCEVRFACHGGCPKNRFIHAPGGEPGLNFLCPGYKHFFNHVDRPMKIMARLLRERRPPAAIMPLFAQEQEEAQQAAFAVARRNDPCPCGSGRKYKQCHGRKKVNS